SRQDCIPEKNTPMKKVTIRDYYDLTPSLGNAQGDIWADLPTHGLLGAKTIPGIVITPACDLANCKVETITYLPIVPVTRFFSLTAALPELRRAVDGQLNAASLNGLLQWPDGFTPPDNDLLAATQDLISDAKKSGRLGANQIDSARRAEAGLRILRTICDESAGQMDASDIRHLFGDKEWLSLRTRIVRNAFRPDLYFLPADGQPPEWSGISVHSLVLFRYSLTAPVEIFEAAQNIEMLDWRNCCEGIACVSPIATAFANVKPMKRISLRPDFLSDLLTRYVGIYIRLGSPDFTKETVSQYCEELNCSK
ncbi:MAG TPA: hypothetical protein VM260_22170, partial [Pirellula sp.]|nr:hypothetical protein [Pirellula sp.]